MDIYIYIYCKSIYLSVYLPHIYIYTHLNQFTLQIMLQKVIHEIKKVMRVHMDVGVFVCVCVVNVFLAEIELFGLPHCRYC